MAALIVAALSSATATDDVTLTRKAKVGDTSVYQLKVELEVQGMEIEFSASITERILKIADDGSITIEETTEDVMVMVNGGEMPQESEVSTSTFGPSGVLKEIDGPESGPEAYRFASLMNFMWPTKPVDVGSSWTVNVDANKENGTYDMRFRYKVLARESLLGHDTLKISFSNSESGGGDAATKGTVWIDVSNGVVVKVDGEMMGVPMQGMSIDGTYSLVLQS